MKNFTRRFLIAGTLGATLLAAGCNSGARVSDPATIDQRADASLEHLFLTEPGAQDLNDKAAGVLIMPLISEAGFGFGGSYGRGVLRVGGVSVDYYSATEASFGLQIGAQQYAQALFFMTEEALQGFRASQGWSAAADLKVQVIDQGEKINASTTTALAPIVAIFFGQAGLIAGATLEGAKYSRINP